MTTTNPTPPSGGLDRFKDDLHDALAEVLAEALAERNEARRQAPAAPWPRPRPWRRRPWRRRPWPRLLAGGAAAALLAAGILAVDGLAPGGRPIGASAEATALLSRAAINAKDPVVGGDQYLLITTRSVYAGITQLPDGREITAASPELSEVWIPADPSRDWVERRTREPEVFASAEDEAAVTAELGQKAAAGLDGGQTELRRAKEGAFYGPVEPSWQTPTAAFLAGLPREPRQLLDRIYDDSRGQGNSRDGEALVFVADLLRAGRAPADLRAALFEAATLIPGVQVTDRRANLDGRVGVAVAYNERGNDVRQELIFDPDSGEVIGERYVDLNGHGLPGLPAGVTGLTSVRVSVVDRAP